MELSNPDVIGGGVMMPSHRCPNTWIAELLHFFKHKKPTWGTCFCQQEHNASQPRGGQAFCFPFYSPLWSLSRCVLAHENMLNEKNTLQKVCFTSNKKNTTRNSSASSGHVMQPAKNQFVTHLLLWPTVWEPLVKPGTNTRCSIVECILLLTWHGSEGK